MIIHVVVRPASGRQEIVAISETDFKVWLKSPAKDGKANEELQKVLTRYFKRKIVLIRGLTSSRKTIEVL